MSTRELKRAGVLARVKAATLSLRSAAALMEVSYRQAKRIYRRYRQKGAAGLKHRSAGRVSNRATTRKIRTRVLALVREKYGGEVGARFGPTLAAEHLASEDDVTVDHDTLRRWLLAAGLWSRARKRSPHRRRRERKAHFGELVQMDGSFHLWFDGRAPASCLLTLVDDATGKTVGRFGAQETIWAAVEVLRAWIDRYGIRIIPASSPQAKGRIERNHGTQQDRLVKKLRRKGIADLDTANAFLDTAYWGEHNERFAHAPASPDDFHVARPRGLRLDTVFRLEERRTVSNDWVVRYDNRLLQLERQSGHPPARGTVLVCEGADGQIEIRYRDRVMRWTDIVSATPLRPPAATAKPPRRPGERPAVVRCAHRSLETTERFPQLPQASSSIR